MCISPVTSHLPETQERLKSAFVTCSWPPPYRQDCDALRGQSSVHLVCVYMHGVLAEDGASNSLIVVTVTGKQLVLGTVFWREVWISLLFRSLCLTNNEIVTAVIFPKEFHKLLFFFCQTLTKRLPVGAGQCTWHGSDMAAQSLGLAWTLDMSPGLLLCRKERL